MFWKAEYTATHYNFLTYLWPPRHPPLHQAQQKIVHFALLKLWIPPSTILENRIYHPPKSPLNWRTRKFQWFILFRKHSYRQISDEWIHFIEPNITNLSRISSIFTFRLPVCTQAKHQNYQRVQGPRVSKMPVLPVSPVSISWQFLPYLQCLPVKSVKWRICTVYFV